MERETLEKYMLKEIDLVQDIIKRMAYNSFMVKGWSLTLIVVTLLIKGEGRYSLIAFLPLISFWYLDGYFLRQERLYRKLYEWIAQFRLDSSDHLFELTTNRFSEEVPSTISTIASLTLLVFYSPIAILIVIASFIL